MDKPKFEVDFNELIEPDLVGLSASDTKVPVSGEPIMLYEGLEVHVFEEDDFQGVKDDLVASGIAVRNTTGFLMQIKWCCRIDANGIRHESDLPDKDGSH